MARKEDYSALRASPFGSACGRSNWLRQFVAVPTHALFGRKSGRSEITRENTSVTHVFATTNFYGAAKRIRSAEPRIVRGTKVGQWCHRARTLEARM